MSEREQAKNIIDTCKGNASALPSFLWKRPGGAYFFCRPIPGKGGPGWRGGIPPYAGEPPVS